MNKFKLLIFNLIIIGIATVCILSFLFASLWKVTFTAKIDDDTIGDFLGSSAQEIDLSLIDVDIEVGFSVEIKPSVVIGAFTAKNNKKTIKELIKPTITDLEGQVKSLLKPLMSSVVKMGINMALTELEDSIDEDTLKQIEDVDLDVVVSVFEKALGGDIDSQTASDEIYALIAEKIEEMEIPEEDREAALKSIQENLDGIFVEYFDEIIDEVGVINPDRTVEMILEQVLDLESGEYSSDILLDAVVEKIPSDVIKSLMIGLKVLGGMLIVGMLGWAFVILSAIFKILGGRGAKLWTAKLLSWIPGIILFVVPSVALLLVKNLVSDAADVFAMFSVKFMSISGVISLIGLVALIVLRILGFNRARKEVEKERRLMR